MQWGNRRFGAVLVLGAIVAAALSGCSAATVDSTNGEAVAIGQQAIGFTATGGSSAGWTSPIPCPDGFEEGLRSTTPAADTLTKVDPTTVSGPVSDPQLSVGYVATCAYSVTSPSNSVMELVFFDMDSTHISALTAKLTSDGFVSQGATQSTDSEGDPVTQTIYIRGLSRIVVASLTVESTPALLIAG